MVQMMFEKLKPLLPIGLGGVIAAALFVVPDARPIACDFGASLPYLMGD